MLIPHSNKGTNLIKYAINNNYKHREDKNTKIESITSIRSHEWIITNPWLNP